MKRLGKNEIAGNRDHRSENVRLSTLWRFLIPRVYSRNGCPKRRLNVFRCIFNEETKRREEN